jgi:hypothetical protein
MPANKLDLNNLNGFKWNNYVQIIYNQRKPLEAVLSDNILKCIEYLPFDEKFLI